MRSQVGRTVSKAKPVRAGIAYLARRPDGALLLETRPESGLLGGMLGLPGSDWVEGVPVPAPPMDADWRAAEIEVRHTFTHFHLVLTVMVAEVSSSAAPQRGRFHTVRELRDDALPTVMRKALRAGREALGEPLRRRA